MTHNKDYSNHCLGTCGVVYPICAFQRELTVLSSCQILIDMMLTRKFLLYALLTGLILLLTSFFATMKEDWRKELNSSKMSEEPPTVMPQIQQDPHLHNDLFNRSLTLINITDFKFSINNDICNVSSVSLVVIVHSAPQNDKARNIIR